MEKGQGTSIQMGRTLFYILAAAMGMVITITGIGIVTGQYDFTGEKGGYAMLAIGAFLTLYYLNKLRR